MAAALSPAGGAPGHVENDESWYPTTKKSYDELNDPNGDLMTKVVVPATQPHQHRGTLASQQNQHPKHAAPGR